MCSPSIYRHGLTIRLNLQQESSPSHHTTNQHPSLLDHSGSLRSRTGEGLCRSTARGSDGGPCDDGAAALGDGGVDGGGAQGRWDDAGDGRGGGPEGRGLSHGVLKVVLVVCSETEGVEQGRKD